MSSTYSIAIAGIKAGVAKETTIKQLVELLKVSEEKVVSMLNSQKFVVKSGVDLATAAKYETAIRSCGCVCIVEPDATGTEDLIFDIPESLKPRFPFAAAPRENQEPLVRLNPRLLKVAFFSVLLVLSGILIVQSVYMMISFGALSVFTGGNSVALAGGIIKQSLKSPSSFSLISGKEMWEGETVEGKSAYIVEVEYDAQNGFGASLRDCKVVSFYEDGDAVKWSHLWGSLPCSSNPNHGGLLEDSKVVEVAREKNSFK